MERQMDQTQWMQLIAGLAVLIILLPSVIYVFRQKTALRNAAIWLALFSALVWGYHVLVELPAQKAMPASITESTTEEPAPVESDTPVRNL
jgi:predicted aspartyl protease